MLQNRLNVDTNRDGTEFCTVGTGVLDGPFFSCSKSPYYKTKSSAVAELFVYEIKEIISFVGMCTARAVKDGQSSVEEWNEYLIRWNQAHNYPEEVLEHIKQTICQTLKTLGIYE